MADPVSWLAMFGVKHLACKAMEAAKNNKEAVRIQQQLDAGSGDQYRMLLAFLENYSKIDRDTIIQKSMSKEASDRVLGLYLLSFMTYAKNVAIAYAKKPEKVMKSLAKQVPKNVYLQAEEGHNPMKYLMAFTFVHSKNHEKLMRSILQQAEGGSESPQRGKMVDDLVEDFKGEIKDHLKDEVLSVVEEILVESIGESFGLTALLQVAFEIL
ncbi:unnamed protein product [Symbiodinium necroappetens]|uniref:Uncharacterized protein n=1 Tax=Symbiodinium necroappetens TaxID=1628268 RepID=A0A813CNL9_9DINO|nr:unnamed protein product [Symbiodinium necroappetens]